MNQVVKIIDLKNLTPRIKVFRLAGINSKKLKAFSPGSHVVVEIPVGQKIYRNSYTLCSSSEQTDFYDLAVLLSDNSRGGSQYLHQSKIGTELNISFPKNSFTLASFAKKYILIAGGIGITPYLSMMAYLSKNNILFELHYSVKLISECAFYNFIKHEYSPQTKFYFSELEEYISSTKVLKEQPLGTHVYLCAPHSLRKDFITEAKSLGYPSSAIHQEIFGTKKANQKQSFTANLIKSKQKIVVAKDRTLLEALEAAKVPINYSCRVGGCGACEVKVIAGDIEHRDSYYSTAEKAKQDRILTCISRAKNQQLTIDL